MVSYVSKSLDDAVMQVRLTVNDVGVNGANFRYTNDQIVAQFNTAIRELYRYRPDAFIGNFTQGVLSNTTPLPTYNATIDLGLFPQTVLPFDDRFFFNAVIFFMVGMLELGDDEFTDTSRSAQLLSSFRQMLIGAGG
jgi:hypothetical protein